MEDARGRHPDPADRLAAEVQLDAFRAGYARRGAPVDPLAALAAPGLRATNGQVTVTGDRHAVSGARARLSEGPATTADALSALVANRGEPVVVGDAAVDPRLREHGLAE